MRPSFAKASDGLRLRSEMRDALRQAQGLRYASTGCGVPSYAEASEGVLDAGGR